VKRSLIHDTPGLNNIHSVARSQVLAAASAQQTIGVATMRAAAILELGLSHLVVQR